MFIETNNETTGPDDEEEREEDSDEDGVSMLAHTLHHNHITWDNLTLHCGKVCGQIWTFLKLKLEVR